MPLIDDRLITFDAALGFDWRAYVDLAYKQAFFDIRAGTSRLISLDHPQGLIAFPSYHWTLSVLTVIAFWRVRIWFWPVLALNLAVICLPQLTAAIILPTRWPAFLWRFWPGGWLRSSQRLLKAGLPWKPSRDLEQGL